MSIDDRGWSDEEQLVQYLAEFGFNRNEARIYLAALGRPPLRVAELAELADVNRPKAYDALRQLVEKGLFEQEGAGQEPARFKAADPMLVVQRLRHQSALEQADRVPTPRCWWPTCSPATTRPPRARTRSSTSS